MTAIEQKRFDLQKALDSKKNAHERNLLGQYSTPYKLAKQICSHISTYVTGEVESFLEPAIGTGVFYSALTELFDVKNSVGFEIDPHYFDPVKMLWADYKLRLINEDFLKASPLGKFSLIIANPPYTRHHYISTEIKNFLLQKVESEFGLKFSGLSGLYCYFMALSTLWLEKDGLSCWLVPAEFLSVNYGVKLKEFLLTKVDLLSVHSFDKEDLQFDDALVSSAVVIFRNTTPTRSPIIFSWGNDINHPDRMEKIHKSDLKADSKWNEAFLSGKNNNIQQDDTLGSYFTIKRGIATGNNKFFIVDRKIIAQYDLPKELLTPIIPPPRKLTGNIYDNILASQDSYYLISSDMPMGDIKKTYPGYYRYLVNGIAEGVNLQYNCRHREIWYDCEKRAVAPILLSYMGRNKEHSPFRFILNQTDAVATNSYLLLYPQKGYERQFEDENVKSEVWKILCKIPGEELIAYGRCYGGGLFKLEPKEVSSIPCKELSKVLKTAITT